MVVKSKKENSKISKLHLPHLVLIPNVLSPMLDLGSQSLGDIAMRVVPSSQIVTCDFKLVYVIENLKEQNGMKSCGYTEYLYSTSCPVFLIY